MRTKKDIDRSSLCYAVIAVGVVLAIIRIWMGFAVEPESPSWVDVYKDVAHLFIGGLAVAWWHARHRWQWRLFWSLNVVEVAVAVLSRIEA